jgi:hypothetical protein
MTTQAAPRSRVDGMPRAPGEGSRAGVGYSEQSDSHSAGAEAARHALDQAGGAANLVLLYATSKHDPASLRDGVRSVVGPLACIAGGSSVGSITNTHLGYEGYQVGVAVISSQSIQVDLFAEWGLDVRGEEAVGRALGKRIAEGSYAGDPSLVLMYDSVKKPQAELNVATLLLQAMGKELRTWPDMAGVGMFGSMQFTAATQWFDDQVMSQGALALVLSGGVRMHTIIMHGCRPTGRYYTITKSDGARVLEIDGVPALDFLGALLPDKQWEEYPLFVTLGVNRGDKFGEFRESDYSNHLCMAIDRERGALVMFEPNLVPGTEVQLMRRSIDFDYIAHRVDELFENLGERTPFFALYIDCAGRAAAFCGTDREEGEEVQREVTARGVPLLGMYSGVEIAKLAGQPQPLDWTGVLCVFSE